MYEYTRQSQGIRDELNGRGKSDQGLQCPFFPNLMYARVLLNVRRLGRSTLQSPFFPNLTLSQLGVLFVALLRARFPKPWKGLSKKSQARLIPLLACLADQMTERGDKKLFPPVLFEKGVVEFAPCMETADRLRHWRLESARPSLLKSWECFSRKYFYGII
jgi:hypothetical protein